MGVDISEETAFREVVRLAPESAYKEGGSDELKGDISQLGEPNTALIFASQARSLGVGVGDPLTVRAQTLDGVANTADVTVIAVAEDVGLLSTFALFLPKETLRTLYQFNATTTGMVMGYLKDPDDASNALGKARSALQQAGYDVMDHSDRPFFAKFQQVRGEDWTGQKLDLTTWQDQISFLNLILTAINTVSFFLIVVLGVIIGVGMINTMLMSVRERTGEIGTLRAMGMQRAHILLLFMLEAMILGFVAGGFVGLLGAGAAMGLDAAQIHIPVEAVLAITAFSAFAALWPSLKAARMQPVDAIRHSD